MHRDTRVRLFNYRMPGHIVLAVCGELDIVTTEGLRDQVTIVLGDTPLPVIVDLSGVSSCDASGPALLLGAQRRAELRGLTGSLAAPRRNVGKLLRISSLDHAFAGHPTLAAARRGQERSYRPAAA